MHHYFPRDWQEGTAHQPKGSDHAVRHISLICAKKKGDIVASTYLSSVVIDKTPHHQPAKGYTALSHWQSPTIGQGIYTGW